MALTHCAPSHAFPDCFPASLPTITTTTTTTSPLPLRCQPATGDTLTSTLPSIHPSILPRGASSLRPSAVSAKLQGSCFFCSSVCVFWLRQCCEKGGGGGEDGGGVEGGAVNTRRATDGRGVAVVEGWGETNKQTSERVVNAREKYQRCSWKSATKSSQRLSSRVGNEQIQIASPSTAYDDDDDEV